MEPLELLQERWRAGFVLHINGLVFGDGRVLLIDAKTVLSGTTVKTVATPLANTTASSVLRHNATAWVTVTRLATLVWSPSCHVECGEGAMGNEGYIAAVDDHDGSLIWMLFCTASNPFVDLYREDDTVVVEGGYDQRWRIPWGAPEKFSIE